MLKDNAIEAVILLLSCVLSQRMRDSQGAGSDAQVCTGVNNGLANGLQLVRVFDTTQAAPTYTTVATMALGRCAEHALPASQHAAYLVFSLQGHRSTVLALCP